MSIHIDAEKNDIAENILLPGDPLRAKFAAETFLKDAKCINQVRGMLGFTGTYQGKRITIIGSGMGQASLGIYVNELIKDYSAKKIIRIGTCGSYQGDVKIKDIVLAQSASTDANHNRLNFNGNDYSACSSFDLLHHAYRVAKEKGIKPHVGNILSSDSFYPFDDKCEQWKKWAKFGVLAVEMESNALYTLGALYGVQTLSVLTVSDSLVTGESTSKLERQNTFNHMCEIALQTIIA